VLDDWDGMGQRATGTGTAIFENVAVAPEETLQFAPPESGSEPSLYLSGAFFQLYVTALEAGVLRALRVDAVAHVHQRARSFTWAPSPSAPDDPLLQREIGEIASAAYAAEATVLAAADALAIAYGADVDGTDPNLDLAHEASLRAGAPLLRARRRRGFGPVRPRLTYRPDVRGQRGRDRIRSAQLPRPGGS
jgi:alkylation response protein AidB-like acyl-CoA dehydrogenase